MLDEIVHPLDLDSPAYAAGANPGIGRSYFDEYGYLILWSRDIKGGEAPILRLESKSTHKDRFAYLKLLSGYRVALLKMSKEEWRDYRSHFLLLNELPKHRGAIEDLPLYQRDLSFKKWLDLNPNEELDHSFSKSSGPAIAQWSSDFPFTLEDYVLGRCGYLHPRLIYGDGSHFAHRIREWFQDRDDTLISDLEKLPSINEENKKLLRAFLHLRNAFDVDPNPIDQRNKTFANDNLDKAIEQLNLIANGNGYYRKRLVGNPYLHGESNTTLQQSFREKFNTSSHPLGYWMAAHVHNEVLGSPKSNLAAIEKLSANTATLFFGKNPITQGDDGAVLWFSIELHRLSEGEIGILVPDLFCFGLTDFSQLLKPIEQCWEASGLAGEFRGVWRLTAKYPGEKVPFKNYDHHAYISKLEGSSLQAAVLVAMWAASGRIPLAKRNGDSKEPLFHSVDGKSLRLIPNMAVSAAILSNHTAKDTSIPLTSIAERSIVPKVQALVSYSPSRKPEESYFDTAIVVGKDAEEIRKWFTATCEDDPKYRRIHISEKCETIGDVLDLMLEVNVIKKLRADLLRRKWEGEWGFDRDENGRFRLRDGSGLITVSDTDSRNIQLKNHRDITIEGVDPHSLSEKQREELISRVKTLGIGTGEVEYLKRNRKASE